MQAKLEALNLFMVGAGALGCEFLKNFAMMGVACGPSGARPSCSNVRMCRIG